MARRRIDYGVAAIAADRMWTRDEPTALGGWAQDADGNRVDVWDPRAVSFNLYGACIRAVEAQVGRGQSTGVAIATVERRVLRRRKER